MKQILMFPDPRPLVETLGPGFFRQVPECPGVYLMRDESGGVLYVGKARNLRKRLNAYRVANPDRMPRRHLRLLRQVAGIDLQPCVDEASALARESELLRLLKPRFNRAGVWQGPPRFLLWRSMAGQLELAVSEASETGWHAFGPLKSGAFHLRAAVARLLWLAVHPGLGCAKLPLGWAHGRIADPAVVSSGPLTEEAATGLEHLFCGHADAFCQWLRSKLPPDAPRFDAAALEADLELVAQLRPLLHPA